MKFALGVMCVWVGAACLWVATHGTEARTPWQAYQEILGGIRNS